jgi:hypothetical protein
MATSLRRCVSAGLAAATFAVVSAACGGHSPRPYERQAANALPERDPLERGTVAAQHQPLSEAEQVVARMGRDPQGRVVVLQIISPVLSPEQQEEVRRAFAKGDWKRQVPVPTQTESWIETIVRDRP